MATAYQWLFLWSFILDVRPHVTTLSFQLRLASSLLPHGLITKSLYAFLFTSTRAQPFSLSLSLSETSSF
jgi:hypothetical protein